MPEGVNTEYNQGVNTEYNQGVNTEYSQGVNTEYSEDRRCVTNINTKMMSFAVATC